jgi:hypothetical protein
LSLLTMVLLTLVAILIAWLLFRHQPEVDPGPLIPTPSGTRTVTVTPTTPPPGTQNPTTGPGSPSVRPSTSLPTPGGTVTGPFPTTSPGGSDSPSNPNDRF